MFSSILIYSDNSPSSPQSRNNNPELGIREIVLTYNGNKEVEFNSFAGSQEVFQFGTCGGENPSPTSIPVTVGNPTVAPTLTPSIIPVGDECPSGESLLEMTLETDQWSLSENYLFLFDATASDAEWVWVVTLFELQASTAYVSSACLVPTTCYKFYFFDKMGDGLASGGLTLKQGGNVVLQISPGDNGILFEDDTATTYWYHEFGTCNSNSYSTATNENF